VSAAVVACVDAPPVLEFPEHILDLMPCLVEVAVMGDGYLSVGSRGDAGDDAACGEGA
jgi:hypothetical protein